MTDADLLRIAQECGPDVDRTPWCTFSIDELRAFADRIRAATIEECAKEADRIADTWADYDVGRGAKACAAAIRALGEAVR